MTPSDLADKRVHPRTTHEMSPACGPEGPGIRDGITFRELAAIHIHTQFCTTCGTMTPPDMAAALTLSHVDALIKALANTPGPE